MQWCGGIETRNQRLNTLTTNLKEQSMNRIVHFEIHSEQPQRAIDFYTGVFGWRFQSWGPPETEYWIITTGSEAEPGINGGLLRRRGPAPGPTQPVNAFPCTVSVSSVDEMVQRIESHGGSVAAPKMSVNGVGWLAYCKDVDGNIIGLMQTDPAAR